MVRAQRRGRRRFPGTSRKNAPSPLGLGHWRNDCVGRASALGEDSKCTKSPGTEKANNEGTTPGPQCSQEGDCGRDREGGGMRGYQETRSDVEKCQPQAGRSR